MIHPTSPITISIFLTASYAYHLINYKLDNNSGSIKNIISYGVTDNKGF